MQYFIGISKQEHQQILEATPRLRNMHRGSFALTALLCKLRTGDSGDRLSCLFQVPRRTIETLMSVARNILLTDYVPQFLGFSHLRREQVAAKTTNIANHIFDAADFVIYCFNRSSLYVGDRREDGSRLHDGTCWEPTRETHVPKSATVLGSQPACAVVGPIASSALLRTPRPSAYASQVSSPAEFMEIPKTSDTPKGVSVNPSSSSVGRERKLVYNVDDPELADLVNYGSDPDDDEGVDEDDDVFGYMQCPRNERIYLDSLMDFDAPMDLPTEPSSSAESISPPPSTPAPSTSTPSTPVSAASATQGPHSLAEFYWESLPIPAIPPSSVGRNSQGR
ncbi:unnamed protein product [Parnassius apollo]|uniref:(apollo) hypothetical protein n=1 Tax=Parnassius apollo TaxID=110799 RepID=A0A8S3WTK1_PARAO|nr:unnamed protein product [Parnassius apollo]